MPSSSKPNRYSRMAIVGVASSSVCVLYTIASLLIVRSKLADPRASLRDVHVPTDLRHIAFGIASSKATWPARKDYVRAWWKPNQTRGCVFLDEPEQPSQPNDTSLPPVCVSGDTSRFRYAPRWGHRSVIRVARVVSDTVALNLSGEVRWLVFGHDDTVFFPENVAKTLSKYDHELWYYVGTWSEDYGENNAGFGFGMASGGAGFAVSYPLAKVLAKVLDSCLERYAHIYGGDTRVYACVAELGVHLTREPGFHQIDIRGDMFGLLASHPLTPLVSLHHLDHTNPIFPGMKSGTEALHHLLKASTVDPHRLLRQSICYDRWFSWTIVVSWGYAVQVHGEHVQPPDLLHVPKTFGKWNERPSNLSGVYTFTTKKLDPDTCRRPSVFFLHNVTSSQRGGIETTYLRSYVKCSYDSRSPKKLEIVRVFSHKLELGIKQLLAPRRHCCDVIPSASASAGNVLDIAIRECEEEELTQIHNIGS